MKGPFLTNQADGKIRSHGLFVLFEEKAFTPLLYLRNIIPERFFFSISTATCKPRRKILAEEAILQYLKRPKNTCI